MLKSIMPLQSDSSCGQKLDHREKEFTNCDFWAKLDTFLLIKMYWNIAMPIHVCIVYGYFHSTAEGLESMTDTICPSLCTANTQMKEISEFSPRPFVLWACQALSLFPGPKRVKKESRALRLFVQAKEYRSGMRVRGLQSIHLILALLSSTGGHCVITQGFL